VTKLQRFFQFKCKQITEDVTSITERPHNISLLLHSRNILSNLRKFSQAKPFITMIKEKVSLSQTVRLITWIVIPIIVIFGLLIPIRDFMHATNPTAQTLCGFVILIVLLSLCSIMLYAPKEITLDDSALTLARGKGKLRIKLADIEEVQRYDPRSTGNIRIFGIGGIYGYVGRYYNHDIGYYTSYVGDYSQAFFIRTGKGKKYLLSCNNADRVAEEIKRRLAKR